MSTPDSSFIRRWLGSLGLAEHAQAFEENAITPDVLPTLTDDDLVELGVSSPEQRATLLAACAQPVEVWEKEDGIPPAENTVEVWLQRHGFTEFAPAFVENAVTPELLPTLTDEDLRELGVGEPERRSRLLALMSGASSGDSTEQAPAPSIPPASPGRYKVVRPLGKGGFGDVFVARDTVLHREVALKRLLRPDESTKAEGLDAFAREATTLASLNHPNVVQLFDFARDDEGVFIIMELLHGRTLDAAMGGTPLPWEDFVQLVRQSLQALSAAHHAGMLHRDLKPENLFLHQQSSGGWVLKVLDFGLAKFHQKARPETSEQTGMVVGSVHFIAPEQLLTQPLSPATDLYALGCVFYWVLSRHHAFGGATVAAVVDAHVRHLVEPLTERVPALPTAVTAWVMRLISVHPEDRPDSADEALRQFEAALASLNAPPVVATPPPVVSRAKPAAKPSGPRKPARPGKPAARPPGPAVIMHAPTPQRSAAGWLWLVVVAVCVALLPLSVWHFWQKRQGAVKPVASGPKPAAASVALTLAAKDARLNGRSFKRVANGDIGSWTNARETIAWSVTVPAAGAYSVELTYALPAAGNGTVITVTGGGKPLDVTLKSTGKDWYAYQSITLGSISFAKPGKATLTLVPKVKRTTGVINVRSVTLRRNGT